MNCKGVKKRLSPYIDNEMSLKERRLIENHLKECSACAVEEKKLLMVFSFMDKVPAEEASPFFAERVLSKAKTGRGESRRVYFLKPVLAGFLAIVLLIIGIAGLNFNNMSSPGFYAYLKNFDDFPPESFSSIYMNSIKGDSR